jgi:hypothetical protein
MLRGDARTEALRRAGLFGGAVLFASWCTQWIYHFVVGGGQLRASSQGPLSVMFVVFGAYAAIVLHDRILKAAAVVFAMQHLLVLIPTTSARATVLFISNALIGVTAILLIVAGARHRTRKDLVVAVGVFVVAVAGDVGLTEYGRYVLGGRSVTYGQSGPR